MQVLLSKTLKIQKQTVMGEIEAWHQKKKTKTGQNNDNWN